MIHSQREPLAFLKGEITELRPMTIGFGAGKVRHMPEPGKGAEANDAGKPEQSKLPESAPPKNSGAQNAKPLTAEEQMERYEESLKETDWGHQPC